MEVEGAGAGAGAGLVFAFGGELGGLCVEREDVDEVGAEVVEVAVSAVGREAGEVGVGGLLAVQDGAVAGEVLGPDGLAEGALLDEEAGGGACAVVGGEQGAAGGVEGDVAGAGAGGVARGAWGELAVFQVVAGDFAGRFAVEGLDLAGGEEDGAVLGQDDPVDVG